MSLRVREALKKIYCGHGPLFPLPDLFKQLKFVKNFLSLCLKLAISRSWRTATVLLIAEGIPAAKVKQIGHFGIIVLCWGYLNSAGHCQQTRCIGTNSSICNCIWWPLLNNESLHRHNRKSQGLSVFTKVTAFRSYHQLQNLDQNLASNSIQNSSF